MSIVWHKKVSVRSKSQFNIWHLQMNNIVHNNINSRKNRSKQIPWVYNMRLLAADESSTLISRWGKGRNCRCWAWIHPSPVVMMQHRQRTIHGSRPMHSSVVEMSVSSEKQPGWQAASIPRLHYQSIRLSGRRNDRKINRLTSVL